MASLRRRRRKHSNLICAAAGIPRGRSDSHQVETALVIRLVVRLGARAMSGRVEIITGPERRRRWSEEEKLQLVEEACRPGHSVSQVARQRGINASQLFAWRRQALAKGLVSDNRPEPKAVPALTFAPVNVT